MNHFILTLVSIASFLFVSCSSTSSTLVPASSSANPAVAVLPLKGALGEQGADLNIEQLALNGIATVERSSIKSLLREHGYRGDSRFDQNSIAKYGELLGVSKVFTGTVTAKSGPLYSFDHVNITLKVIDVSTGQVTWIGRYGNSLWSSAISTQGDLQRGTKNIVKEFVKVHGTKF